MLPCLLAIAGGGQLAGCGGGSGTGAKAAEPSAEQVAHSEEASQKKQEVAEVAEDRELLSKIEG